MRESFWQAWHRFVKAYQDQETKEISTILSFCNFKEKRVLDVGAGIGRLAFRFAPLCSKLYVLEKDKKLLKELTTRAKKANLMKKIIPLIGDCTSLQFSDNFFDVVYSAWVLQSVKRLDSAIKEMVRVTRPKGAIIIVLASGEGDETKIRSFLEHSAGKNREKRIKTIKEILHRYGCKVKEKRKILYFHFPPRVDEVYETLLPITFQNKKLSIKTVEKIKKYLEKLLKNDKLVFTQGASFISGYKG